MFPNDTNSAWEYFGDDDPYFDELTKNRVKTSDLNQIREHYYSEGRKYIDGIFETINQSITSTFHPKRALDFGCGVGRLLIPLASRCDLVEGIDISKPMLKEAEKNLKERGIKNVRLLLSDDQLSQAQGPYDFINSYVVFQHIPRKRGQKIIRRMIDLLEEGGIGALHITYFSKAPFWIKVIDSGYKNIPFLYGIRNLFRGRSFSEPLMQMNEYDLNTILKILFETGCHNCHLRFTDHKMLGVTILFRKEEKGLL